MKKIKTFTVQQFVDAIRKNGFNKAKSTYYRDKRGTSYSILAGVNNIGSACAYGQAAINLGVRAPDLRKAHTYDDRLCNFSNEVIRLNDGTSLSMEKIADKLEERFPDLMTLEFEVY